jgi:type III secretory pathway component EscT
VDSLLAEVAAAFAREGVDLASLGLAWARAAPAVAIVPAFGLRALPAPARAVLGLALAACVFPAMRPIVADLHGQAWIAVALEQVLRGVPIALAAAVPLWAATMAGGLADALRGAQDTASAPTVEGRASPLGVTLSLLAGAIFLRTGGPARVADALAALPVTAGAHGPWLAAAHDVTLGISLAVALGAPLLAAAVVLEVAGALIARAASPAQIHALLAPLRALGTLAVLAIVIDRLAQALTRAMP